MTKKWTRPRLPEPDVDWKGAAEWARRRRGERALVEHAGDPVSAAAATGIPLPALRKYLRAAGFRERLEQAMTAAGLTYEATMTVLKEGMTAEKPIISTKTGEIIETVADHPTRVGAAGKLLGVMSALARAERPDPDESPPAEAPLARPLTREEFFALTDAARMRVTMEQQRIVIEPNSETGTGNSETGMTEYGNRLSWRERNRLGWTGGVQPNMEETEEETE